MGSGLDFWSLGATTGEGKTGELDPFRTMLNRSLPYPMRLAPTPRNIKAGDAATGSSVPSTPHCTASGQSCNGSLLDCLLPWMGRRRNAGGALRSEPQPHRPARIAKTICRSDIGMRSLRRGSGSGGASVMKISHLGGVEKKRKHWPVSARSFWTGRIPLTFCKRPDFLSPPPHFLH